MRMRLGVVNAGASSVLVAVFTAAVLGVCTAAAVKAQRANRGQAGGDTTVYLFDPIVVTATRSPRPAFLTPAPVAVIDSAALLRIVPNTVTDLFRELPGMDVTGVGVQQPRPIIRGQRGQRILLLQDGIRLNNSRRQQDFGEVPALIDVATVERVEVVRGPASVLYGTDAIGGVVNVITRRPAADGVHGAVGYRFGETEDQHKGSVLLHGRQGDLDFLASGTARDARSYVAPKGRFGEITLNQETVVHGTGVHDRSAQARLGYTISDRHRVFVRGEGYEAEDASFGFVDPADYAASQPRIDIQYPHQRFMKLTAGYSGTGLSSLLADGLDVTVYGQSNERNLNFDLFQSFGPQAPPGAGVRVQTFNYTDLGTTGVRLEARKLAAERLLLTYGVDGFRDRSENTDSSITRVTGFGPPQVRVANTPLVPNATYRSLGAFLQGEVTVSQRATLILGGRLQDVRAETEPTAGITETFEAKANRTAVGAANLLLRVADPVTLIGSVGRAFRSPNLIEWFFDGPTPEGNGYQLRSPELEPETSINVDLGVRWRSARVFAEAFAFRNHIRDGIRISPTGTQVGGLPAFRNVNVEKLVYEGIELAGEVAVLPELSLLASYTKVDTEDELDPSNPVGDSFSSKATGGVRYQHRSQRFWAEYNVRHHGARKDVDLGDNPVGDVLPAFTVHDARAGVTLFRRGQHAHRVGVGVHNLGNTLYAESSNVSFFRPEPRRSVTLTYDVVF